MRSMFTNTAKLLICCLVFAAFCLMTTPPTAGATHFETEAPGRIDNYSLDATPEQCDSYGPCGKDGRLRLSDLPGQFLLIEVFSMYCPYCQAAAPDINRLAAMIENSPYSDRMSLVGLGAGNSRFEVDFFRDRYSIAFPLFPDPEMVCYTAVNQPGTPYFILARKNGEGKLDVLWTHRGPFEESVENVFNQILQHAGLK